MTDPNAITTTDAIERITCFLEEGRPDLAASEAALLRARAPQDAQAARLHGIALFQLGRGDDARKALDAARMLAPTSVEVLCNLGSVLLAERDTAAAIDIMERACEMDPTHAAAHNGLGNARQAAGELDGARQAYAHATRAMPGHVGAWLNLGATELALGEPAVAERTARHALQLAPDAPASLLLLGHVLATQRRYAEAEAAYIAASRAAPADARLAYHCGLMAEELKHPAAAADAHARALVLDPDLDPALGQLVFLRRQLCDWRELDALSRRLRGRVAAGAAGIAPFGFLAEPARADEQLKCARTWADAIDAHAAPGRKRLAFAHARPAAEAPLRIGMIANGLGDHPTSLLIVALIEALRGEAIELHLFSTAPDDGSPLLQRLRAATQGWHDATGFTASQVATAIHAAGIELLLDLDGYCSGSIPAGLALRPAPLQVNWLAYPGTLGAPWIDYVIADRIVLPDALRAQFSEQVAWLPRCFQPSDPTRVVGRPPSRAACGLPRDAVVYVCFNNHYKLDPASFERMLAVLREVPDSVLWLLCGPDGADQRLRNEAQRRGVDPARLIFMPKLAHVDYLARYGHADLFLDCISYNAHTTASDAIWAGCPVLTVAGESFASRVAASLNHHLGMPHLNARDDAAFIELAVHLGRDAEARASLHAELAERRRDSGLFDMQAYARDFSSLLQRMAKRHRAGLPPAPLD
ncbi:MAG: tetratricopeptide repeat protein [Dokdonella sp.]